MKTNLSIASFCIFLFLSLIYNVISLVCQVQDKEDITNAHHSSDYPVPPGYNKTLPPSSSLAQQGHVTGNGQ